MTTTMAISLTANSGAWSAAPWANIEQDLSESPAGANLYDVAKMLTYAQTGLSAHIYNQNCNGMSVDSQNIAIPLSVFVWPNPLDLNYTISGVDDTKTAVDMIVSPPKSVQIESQGFFVVEFSDRLEFEHLLGSVSISFETLCYNDRGETIPNPDWRVVDNAIVFDAVFIAGVRINYQALGNQHNITLVWDNNQNSIAEIKSILATSAETKTINSAWGSYEIADTTERDQRLTINIADVTLIVKYTGGSSSSDDLIEESVGLEIPQSVKDCLSQCPESGVLKSGGSTSVPGSDPDQEYDDWKDVYYSTCTGSVIDTNIRKVVKDGAN